ncbi:MAG: FG-GAP-like repeat-containing protein [Myxococcota bacterium]|nr:FG-GAP-like repeat-containing protein [Myxococcota bacterium]
MRSSLLIAVLAVGCVEYDITKPAADAPPGTDEDTYRPDPSDEPDGDSGARPDDTGSPVEEPPPDTDVPPEPTECPPLDVIDAVTIDEACHSEPVTGPMSVATEWAITTFAGFPEYDKVLSTPVVGQLTDDNFDGVINALDTPDIIITTDDSGTEDGAHGVLRRVDGTGAADYLILKRWVDDAGDQYFPYRYTTPALGDIDGDGTAEIVTLFEIVMGGIPDGPPDGDAGPPPDEDHPVGPPPPPTPPPPPGGAPPCHLGALTVDGSIEWMSTETIECGGHAPALADLEADGTVEIAVANMVFEGATGALRFSGTDGKGGYNAYPEVGYITAVSDLDGDGIQEVVAGNTLYRPDGTIRCSRDDADTDGFPAVADFDGDGAGDVVVVGNATATVMDNACTPQASWALLGAGNGGPPTVADFDADGQPEIGVATATQYVVYEPDGTIVWSADVEDASSHATGSSVFDFEGDGRPEVVYADETRLYIFDGPTGAVRLADPTHASRTLHEFPVIVDADGDGEPEIIVPNGGGHHGYEARGLYAISSGDGTWLGGRSTWNQHAYNIVNINDDLSIPSPPEPNWPFHNNFRSGDLNPVYGTDAPDAVALADHCTFECGEGYVLLGVRIGNEGTATLRHDIEFTIYRRTTPEWTAIEVIDVSPPIEPGATSELFEIRVAASAVGAEGIAVVVDDRDGIEVVRECDETNNAVILETAHCE